MRPQLLIKLVACSSFMGAVLLGVGTMTTGQTTTVVQPKAKAKPKAKAETAAPAPLDLNRATAEELQANLPGVGEVMAKRIVAGRPYAKVDDLAKAGVPARTIDAIRGMVTVISPPTAPAAKLKAAAPKDHAKAATATTPHLAAPVNLNTASAEDLETLPGIGPTHAKAIIEGRPYKSVDDLERVKGLGKARIDTLRNLVTAASPSPAISPATAATAAVPKAATPTPAVPKTATAKAAPKAAATRPASGKRVNLNTASKEELDVLPGIGHVKAQAIIEGRPFKSIEDIKRVKGIKDYEYSLIKDMITVD
jgi:competence protein ComEA